MKKTHHTPNQMITKLRKVEAARAEGDTVADAVPDIGVSEQTYSQWKREYASMDRDQLTQLKDLKKENARLKKPVWSVNPSSQRKGSTVHFAGGTPPQGVCEGRGSDEPLL